MKPGNARGNGRGKPTTPSSSQTARRVSALGFPKKITIAPRLARANHSAFALNRVSFQNEMLISA